MKVSPFELSVPPVLTATLLLTPLLACGPVENASGMEDPAQVNRPQELKAGNGLSLNGLSLNGLSLNGLSLNGLSLNGLNAPEFTTWFQSAPLSNHQVMKYLVQCALPAGQFLTYVAPSTGSLYTWAGSLGLAPDWAGGAPATEAEQQIVSACLAAHANKYGIPISISVLGRTAKGVALPYTWLELNTYDKREACFFGNLFTNEGIFVANDGLSLDGRKSSARACGILAGEESVREECPPMAFVGSCEELCSEDSSENYYVSCRYNGKSYRTLTTRLRPLDVYTCGDGICQFTESCGTGEKYNNCKADCGTCY